MALKLNGTFKAVSQQSAVVVALCGVLVWLGQNFFETKQAAAEISQSVALLSAESRKISEVLTTLLDQGLKRSEAATARMDALAEKEQTSAVAVVQMQANMSFLNQTFADLKERVERIAERQK